MSQTEKAQFIQAIENNSLDDTYDPIYNKLKADAEANRRRQEQLLKEGKERHALEQAEKNKFENAYSRKFNYRHVQVFAKETTELCMNAPLQDMQRYHDEMLNGQHLSDFKDPDAAFNFLDSMINRRIHAADPTYSAREILATAQDALKIGKEEIERREQKAQKIFSETQKMIDQANPASPKKANGYVR